MKLSLPYRSVAAVHVLLGVGGQVAHAQRPVDLTPNAPADRPVTAMLQCQRAALQRYAFDVSELVDWMIARPDGTEEGNEVGKFLDTYHRPAVWADSGGAG